MKSLRNKICSRLSELRIVEEKLMSPPVESVPQSEDLVIHSNYLSKEA